MKFIKILRKVFQIIILSPFALIFAVLAVNLGLLIFPILSALFVGYKVFVVALAKCLIPGSKVLSVYDSVMAKDDFHKDTDLYLHFQWVFEGKMQFEDLFEAVDERMINQKRPNGELKFPELTCSIETFLGYFFYKPVKNFDLKNHVTLYKNQSNSIINRKQLDKIIRKYTYELYPKKHSPWGILLVNNVQLDEGSDKECSIMITKCHHCLADAYAGLIIFWEALFQQKLKPLSVPKGTVVGKDKFKSVITICSAAWDCYKKIFGFAFDYVYSPGRLFDHNKWHKINEGSEHVNCTFSGIETGLVKEISSKNGVSITTVLIGLVTGGLKRMMEVKGLKSPKQCRVIYSLPLPNHPDRLTTFATVTFFNVQLTNSEKRETLQRNEKSLKVAARAILAGTGPMAFLGSSIPIAWWRYNPTGKDFPVSSTMFCTNAPLPPPITGTDVQFLGCRLARVYGSCIQSPNVNNPETSLGIMKYKNHFYINYGIQQHLLTNDDQIYEIENHVLEELAHLRKAIMGKETTTITIEENLTKL